MVHAEMRDGRPGGGELQHIRGAIVYRPARVTRSATIVYQSATHSECECVSTCAGHSFGSECVTRDPSSGACRNTFGSRSCIDLRGSQLRVRMCDGRMGAAWWRGVPRHRATAPRTPRHRARRVAPAESRPRHRARAGSILRERRSGTSRMLEWAGPTRGHKTAGRKAPKPTARQRPHHRREAPSHGAPTTCEERPCSRTPTLPVARRLPRLAPSPPGLRSRPAAPARRSLPMPPLPATPPPLPPART